VSPRPGGDLVLLDGSCRCGAVRFRVESPEPYLFMLCYCSICRKTAGGGGYAINLGALSDTLEVEESISVYQATIDGELSPAQRRFCRNCGSALWVYDPRWPELVHPFASSIDTPLPKPPERLHIMLDYAAPWCEIPSGAYERDFPQGPDVSLADWHERHGLREVNRE
jgi:hypothetical protein